MRSLYWLVADQQNIGKKAACNILNSNEKVVICCFCIKSSQIYFTVSESNV